MHVVFKTATDSHEMLWDGPFELCFERNWDLLFALFLWRRLPSVLAVGGHLLVHTCADDASPACAWVAHVTNH